MTLMIDGRRAIRLQDGTEIYEGDKLYRVTPSEDWHIIFWAYTIDRIDGMGVITSGRGFPTLFIREFDIGSIWFPSEKEAVKAAIDSLAGISKELMFANE